MTTPSTLRDGFQKSVGSPDLHVTTALAKSQESDTLFLGMGDGADLVSAGRIARNNASDKSAIETDRKKRNKEALERAIRLISDRLNQIETEMIDLETKIADSSEIIANNQADIDFIRGLDTDNLYDADGKLNGDTSAFLGKHGYNLEGKSVEEIRHMLTEIEVAAIEQNDTEENKIDSWLNRHEHLRRESHNISKDSPSSDQRQRGAGIADRDPELLARKAIEAYSGNAVEVAEESEIAVVEAKVSTETQEFSF